LELCQLSRFLAGQERNQSFKFGCRLVRVVSLSDHQIFKFPDCFVVIYISLLMKVWRGMVSIASSLLRLRGRNQSDSGFGGEQKESECLLQIQADGGVGMTEIADGDVLPDV